MTRPYSIHRCCCLLYIPICFCQLYVYIYIIIYIYIYIKYIPIISNLFLSAILRYWTIFVLKAASHLLILHCISRLYTNTHSLYTKNVHTQIIYIDCMSDWKTLFLSAFIDPKTFMAMLMCFIMNQVIAECDGRLKKSQKVSATDATIHRHTCICRGWMNHFRSISPIIL